MSRFRQDNRINSEDWKLSGKTRFLDVFGLFFLESCDETSWVVKHRDSDSFLSHRHPKV